MGDKLPRDNSHNDEFLRIISRAVTGDKDFTAALSSLDDEFAAAALARQFFTEQAVSDMENPYYFQSLNKEVERFVSDFKEYWAAYISVDSADELSPEQVTYLSSHVVVAIRAHLRFLQQGETIATRSSAVIIERGAMGSDLDRITLIDPNTVLQCTYEGPEIISQPDLANLASNGKVGGVEYGIGFKISNPILVYSDGGVNIHGFNSRELILMLDTPELKLDKIHYRDEVAEEDAIDYRFYDDADDE